MAVNAPLPSINASEIKAILDQALKPTHIQVLDEGVLHASHSNAGAGHFRVIISSPQFKGKTKVQIHRMIYNLLELYLDNGIHALAIDAKSD